MTRPVAGWAATLPAETAADPALDEGLAAVAEFGRFQGGAQLKKLDWLHCLLAGACLTAALAVLSSQRRRAEGGARSMINSGARKD